MTEGAITVNADADASLAARRMLEHRIHHLPVLDSSDIGKSQLWQKVPLAGMRATWSRLEAISISSQRPPVPEVPGSVGPPALAATSPGP